MPLTEFQHSIMHLLSSNRTEDSYLAGGAALHLTPNSNRYSNDLDFFHDSESRVASAFNEDRLTLESMSYHVNVSMKQDGFVRAVIKKDNLSTKLEWAHDSAWRFMPTTKSEIAGYTLHPVDLGINKLLALVGRDEIRDYIDIHEIITHILPLGALCWAAAGKDPGFTPKLLLDLLRRRGKYQLEDLERIDLVKSVNLQELKINWLSALDDAADFIQQTDPSKMGCLFYSVDKGAFIQPGPSDKAVAHYGKHGGILPMTIDN